MTPKKAPGPPPLAQVAREQYVRYHRPGEAVDEPQPNDEPVVRQQFGPTPPPAKKED